MEYRYIYISKNYDLYGINDPRVAHAAADCGPVYDVITGQYFGGEPILEWTPREKEEE